MPTGWFTDGCLDKELIKEAKSLLTTKMFANTKFLKKHLGISGQLAGRIFRSLGWIKYGSKTRHAKYKRPKKWVHGDTLL